ncbi:MAG: D-alanyl-D-alanine carboxypeptidase family protein [Mariprofundaceae bacterium]|nr:D-alanyl-D-alanine carboxypeptidase family protein [Mariprofundaceae bacterium]
MVNIVLLLRKMMVKMAVFVVFVLLLSSAQATEMVWPAEPVLQAKSWVLLDVRSGQILAKHQEKMRLPPASMTKMMTLYVLFEALKSGQLDLDKRVNISEKAWKIGGSTMFLEPRMHPYVRELIHGMATLSGNDAAIALAEHLLGSEADFVLLMNDKAQLLGLKDTLFQNVTGSPSENHYSTALDMAKLGVALWRDFPELYHIFSEKSYSFDGREQWNRNRLLWTLPEATGIKTGHTQEAGYCLTAAAEKGDMRLVSVLFGASSDVARQQESQKLLRYGLDQFITLRPDEQDIRRKVTVLEGKEDGVWLKPQHPVWITIPQGSQQYLSFRLDYNSPQIAPILAGVHLGSIEAVLRYPKQNMSLQSIPMLTEQAVPRASWLGRKIGAVQLWWNQ